MEEIINNIIWCFNIIMFSHIFLEAEKGSIWRYLSVGFILLGVVVLSF